MSDSVAYQALVRRMVHILNDMSIGGGASAAMVEWDKDAKAILVTNQRLESDCASDSALTFAQLSRANAERLPQFRNSKGLLAHSTPDGSDWSPAQWLQAVVGEIGEYANFRKKYERGDITLEEFNVHARKELADVVIYLDLLSQQLSIDLGLAVRDKFNEVSNRIQCGVRI